MKKSVHALILLFICVSVLMFRCNCDPVNPDVEVWAVSPEDEAIVQTQDITFEWDWFADGSEFLSGYLAIRHDTASVFTRITISESDRTLDIDTLDPATTYHWHVLVEFRSYEDYYYERSNYLSFTTAERLLLPGDVHSPTPADEAIGVSVSPNFAWEVYNPDLLGYDFDIYLGLTTDPPLLASGLNTPYYNLVSDTLDHTTLYYWRVEAYYGNDTIKGPLWEFTTDYPSEEDIFALIEIDARQAPSGYHTLEEIRARFDTALAVAAPIEPLAADSVIVEGTKLNWNAGEQNYSFTEWSLPFIENGQPVDISVYGNTAVPNLTASIDFPACTLSIVSPESFNTVSLDGFEVTWNGSECGGMVWLTLLDGTDSTGVWKEVANDGIDSLTAADLTPLGGQTGNYNLAVIIRVEENIDYPGFKQESFIRTRAYNIMELINIQ